MSILNLFIIPVILVSLHFRIRFSYVISLLCSLAGATFIYSQESLINILFTIAVFNLTPLACRGFNQAVRRSQFSLEARKDSQRSFHKQILKECSLIEQSDSRLDKEVSQIAELYRVTREMSGVLGFTEIFNILGKKLMEHFRFKKCRLILVDEENEILNIKKVFELKYAQSYPQQVNIEKQDEELLKESLGARKISYVKDKSIALVPLLGDGKLLGILISEDLPFDSLDNFSILSNQFALEFRRVKLYQKVQELAITDGLTGLYVRRYFLKRLEEEMERSSRHNLRLCFLMIDIDHFKRCNDHYGHLTGDVVLREVAHLIKNNIREIDLAARYGGEEFSVLLPDTDKIGGKEVAERIRITIDGHKFYAYDETLKVEVSIGVANFPEDSNRIQNLIDKSDRALYRAKQEGRNKVMVA